MLQEIEKMKCRDFVQQLLGGTVLNEKHRKIVAQVTSEMEQKNSHRRKFSGGCLTLILKCPKAIFSRNFYTIINVLVHRTRLKTNCFVPKNILCRSYLHQHWCAKELLRVQ